MTKKAQFTRGPLAIEYLEARLAMAGDVFISIKGGSLTLVGDGANNSITVNQTAQGAFTITGNAGETFKQLGQLDTQNPVNVANITNDIKIYLKGGVDSLVLNGDGIAVSLARNLTIQSGGGPDKIEMQDAKLAGNLSIDSGRKGDGDADGDAVELGQFYVAKKTSIHTGRGTDVIEIHDCIFAGNLLVNSGKATGGGDEIDIINSVVAGKTATLISSDGNDKIFLTNVNLNKTIIKTNSGQDMLNLHAAVLDQAAALLGTGDDVVNLGVASTLNGPKKTKILGGKDADTINGASHLTVGSELFLADPTLANSSFESINQ